MPDRFGDTPTDLDVPDDIWSAEQRRERNARDRALAIAHCGLCDDDGYNAARRVCDHRDRTQTAARGHALIQAEFEKIRRRRASVGSDCDPPASTESHDRPSGRPSGHERSLRCDPHPNAATNYAASSKASLATTTRSFDPRFD